jgi:hypothetical protein
VRLINRISSKAAEEIGIPAEQCWKYLRVDYGKPNLKPPEKATWVRLVSIEIGNGDLGHDGEKVQTVASWRFPKATDLVSNDDAAWLRREVERGEYRNSPLSPDWVGVALARRLKLDAKDNRAQLAAIIKALLDDGTLEVRQETGGSDRKLHPFVRSGPKKTD